MIGLEKTAYIIDRCVIYEELYVTTPIPTVRTLKRILIQLYQAILVFFAQTIKRFEGELNGIIIGCDGLALMEIENVLRSIFTTEDLGKYLDLVHAYDNDLMRVVQIADHERISSTLTCTWVLILTNTLQIANCAMPNVIVVSNEQTSM